jgi:tetratricopeptide (TPR) repeat protein
LKSLGQRANELCEIGKFEAALELLERAVTDDPHDPRLWCLASWAASSIRRTQFAIHAAERAIHEAPDYEWGHRVLGLALGRSGRRHEARDALGEAVACDPQSSRAWGLLGEIEYGLGNLRAAKDAARETVRVAPERSGSWNLLGLALEDDWNESVAAWEHALGLEPENPESLHGLAHAFIKLERMEEARALLQRALRLKPGALNFLFKNALVTGWLDGIEAGRDAYLRTVEHALSLDEEAIRRAPDEADGYRSRALRLRRTGRSAEALESARVAVRLDRDNAESWRMLGWVAGSGGRWKVARFALRRSVELDPEDPLRSLENAELAYLTRRTDDQRAWGERLAAAGAENKWASLGRAYCALADGNPQQARSEIEAYFECDPWDCCYRRLHADCCEAVEDRTAAEMSLRRALIRSPECGCAWHAAAEQPR